MVSERAVVFSFAALYSTNLAKDPDGGSFLFLRSTLKEESAADKLGRLAGRSSCDAKELRRAIPLRFNVGRFCAGAVLLLEAAGAATAALLLAVSEAFAVFVREAAATVVFGIAPVFWRRPIRVEGVALAGGAPLDGGGGVGGERVGLSSSPNVPGLSCDANFF